MFYGRHIIDAVQSNFVYDEDQNLSWLNYSMGDFGSIEKWSNEPKKSPTSEASEGKLFKVITRDFVFDDPSKRKKIYKVYVTYKSTLNGEAALSYVRAYYAKNGTGDAKEALVDGNWTMFSTTDSVNHGGNGFTGSSTWQRAELKFTDSSDVNNVYSFQLKFEALAQVPDGFMINDIEIIYRGKNVK